MSYHQSTTKTKKITWLTETLGTMPGENKATGIYWVVSTRRKIKKIAVSLIPLTIMGCSVTSLQCGTDGDSSFVNLNTTPKVLSQNAREMGKLCAFVYDEKE